MTIQQTIDIPANRRLTIEVPPEIPAGRVILAFTPAPVAPAKSRLDQLPDALTVVPIGPEDLVQRGPEDAAPTVHTPEEQRQIDLINKHADELNAEAMDVLSYQVDLW